MAFSPLLRRLLLPVLLLLPAALIGMQEPAALPRGVRVVDIVAAAPNAGGFQPGSITVRAGQKLRLRFHGADSAHGIAIGSGLGLDFGDLAPGEVKVVDVAFAEAGTFTFYCNKWCGPNHWRMRGVIEVQRRGQGAPAPALDPVIQKLADEGIDIDAYLESSHPAAPTSAGTSAAVDHTAAAAAVAPAAGGRAWSAVAGAPAATGLRIPDELRNPQWRRVHTPLEGEALLVQANPQVDPTVLADVTAYLWLPAGVQTSTPAVLPDAAALYAKNCAACHGAGGDGQGFDAAASPVAPPSFADAQRMAGRRADVLYAKIRRGGMGTGMPNFGALFSPEETWSLVDYVWLLAFGE